MGTYGSFSGPNLKYGGSVSMGPGSQYFRTNIDNLNNFGNFY